MEIRGPQPYPHIPGQEIIGKVIEVGTKVKKYKVGKGTKVGVVGFGGLGHMGVKLAVVAIGAEVTVISRSTAKEEEAKAKAIGAKGILSSTDEDPMAKAAVSFDFNLDTVSIKHNFNTYTPLVKTQEVLDVCVEHNIHPGCQIITPNKVNDA